MERDKVIDIQMKNLKMTLIIMKAAMVLGALLLIYCVISFFNYKSVMEECSSVMWGVVSDVEKKSDPGHGFNYKAYVTSENAPGMRFESPSTRHEYIKGESVKIYYDLDDISDYYIQGAEPIGYDVSMIITLLFMLIVVFVIHSIKGKQYRKLCSKQSELPD